ncbi:hypothetical protein [Sphingomonas glacialis]|uniref:Uncharacterized protein n=1 Tax=Sphingomonas glacialis TaxID=658225 RepID=A0A502FYE5_9SPHN|nr:hypothetical protein [Sphingomonas glacialis]TPG54514.1 hypothetical protein EAH76_07630 [Sphingomonas glacialis]
MIRHAFAAIALLSGTAALAQTPIATKTTTKTAAAPTSKTVVTTIKTTPPATTVKATTVAHSRTTKTTTTGGRMVQAKLANGKTVTYNCSLAGNKTKTACK